MSLRRRVLVAISLACAMTGCDRPKMDAIAGANAVLLPPSIPAPVDVPRCPAEMARVGSLCIDRWEAHLVTRDDSGTLHEASPYARPVAGVRYQAASTPGSVPQGYVSRIESALACKNAGKRLCTAREWLGVCEGTKKTVYPYGDRARPGVCNTGKPHLMQKLFGSDMRIYRFDAHYNSPKLNSWPGFLARTGEYSDCVSDAGVADLVGNLHEWVADPVDATFRKLLTERHADFHVFETATDGNGAFLGGFYSTNEQYGAGCGYITPAHDPAYHDYSTGFRCCRDEGGS